MRRPWFYRMLLSYLPIFFFISSFLFFVFFQELSEQSKRDTVRANQVLNLMAMDKVESSLSAVDYALIDFSLNNKVLNRFFQKSGEQNVVLNQEMLKEMGTFKRQNPMVDTMYLARLSDGIVLTEGYMFQLQDFPDRAYVIAMEKSRGSVKWTSARSYREFTTLPEKNVVTLARKHYTPQGEHCLIVINVDLDSLRTLIEQSYNENINFVSISGTDGNTILGESEKDFEVLAEYKSEYLGWTFRSGLVGGAFIQSAFEVSRVWMLLGIVIVILGTVAIVYVTLRNYRPLEKVVAQIRELIVDKAEQAMKTDGNEFALIESTIEEVLKRSNRMIEQQEEGINLRKTHLFYEIIQGIRHITDKEWAAEMARYKLPKRMSGAQVIAIEIDHYAAFSRKFTSHDQYLLKFAVRNSASEILQKHYLFSWCEWISGRRLVCIVLYPDNFDTNLNQQACEELVSWINYNLPLSITIGIGDVVPAHDGISESYKDALQALSYKYLKGLGRTISLSELNARQGVELFSYLESIRSLAHDFRVGDANWTQKYKQLFADIRSDFLSSDDMHSLMNYLIFQLDRMIGDLAPEYQKPWKDKGMPSLTDVFETAETLEDLQLGLLSILYEIGQEIAQAHEATGHHQLLLEVRAFIEANFSDPDMSLERLKEMFDLNPKYLSQLFKDKFGEGFMEFLIRLRIEHAKELLQTTSDSVQSIAGKVGYLNVISFTRTFKKVTSKSPGDFRKQTV